MESADDSGSDMDRKRTPLAGALIGVLTAAAIFEVYYFGFELPGEETGEKYERERLQTKRQEQAAVVRQLAAQPVTHETSH